MGYRTGPKDEEAEALFDPAAGRDNPNATNYCETLMHYIKAVIGTGILALPYVFSKTGTILSCITMLAIAVVVANAACILVQCAQKFCYYSGQTKMTYDEVVDYAFANGPECGKKLAKFMSTLVSVTIFITYFGTCSVYAVVIGSNVNEIVSYFFDINLNIRLVLLILLLPFLLLSWIPNLKLLAPLSLFANIFMFISVCIIFYYFFKDVPTEDHDKFNIIEFPQCLANSIFAMTAVAVIFPLENNMKKPKDFVGIFGVLSVGTAVSVVVYCAFGLFGYLRYGDETKDAIMLNLPSKDIAGKIVQLLISMAVFPSFALHLYIVAEIPWSKIKERANNSIFLNYVVRTFVCIACVGLAIAVPVIAPFMGLLGAFCMSVLGIIVPALIHIAVSWEDGFGFCYCILWKDLLILSIGIFAFLFGTVTSVFNLIKTAQEL